MKTLIQANVFFFVTTIAVVIFIVLGSIALFYVIGILKNVKKASDAIEQRIETAGAQFGEMQSKIANSFLFGLLFGKKRKPKAAPRRHSPSPEN